MMRNMIAFLAAGAVIAPTMAMAATTERPAPVSYAMSSQSGKSLTSGRTGLHRSSHESNLEAATALLLAAGGAGAAAVACSQIAGCLVDGNTNTIHVSP